MSQPEVNRIKQDLATIDQALGLKLIFGWEDVWLHITMLGVGFGLAALGALKISVPVCPPAGCIIAACIVLLYSAITSLGLRRQKNKYPARWREARVAWISVALIVALLVPFAIWSMPQGVSSLFVGSGIIFVGGIAVLTIAICDRNRLHYLGAAIPLIILGPAFPAIVLGGQGLYQHRIDLFIGLFFASTGGLSAGIMAWQLRRRKNG